jgi:hypothetical protein
VRRLPAAARSAEVGGRERPGLDEHEEYHTGDGSNASYIGVPVPRREDPDLMRGAAQTVADLSLPGTVVVSAVCDALDVGHIDMPLTPETAWRAAHQAV